MNDETADRLARIRANLPATWAMGIELDQPDPPAPEQDDPDDDGTEMRGARGMGESESQTGSARKPAAEPFLSRNRIDVHEPRSNQP